MVWNDSLSIQRTAVLIILFLILIIVVVINIISMLITNGPRHDDNNIAQKGVKREAWPLQLEHLTCARWR